MNIELVFGNDLVEDPSFELVNMSHISSHFFKNQKHANQINKLLGRDVIARDHFLIKCYLF
jgi:hypothetical protein